MARAALRLRYLQGPSQQPSAGRTSKNFAPSARRCCRGSPASRCCGTNSTSHGGNGRKTWRQPDEARCAALARGAGSRPRSNSSNSCNGPPTGSSGLPGARESARHEGRPLSRCRGRRAIRRLRCLERAGRRFPAISRVGAPPDPLNTAGPELGPRRLQRRRPGNQVVRAVPGDAAGLDAARRRDPARSRAGPEAALSGAARLCRPTTASMCRCRSRRCWRRPRRKAWRIAAW